MSTITAIFYVISGLIEEASLFTFLDIDIDDVLVFVLIALWVIFSIITTVIISVVNAKS